MAATRTVPLADEGGFQVESFLEDEARKDLLRFTTAGSVDDGKSTLIGRLLYDSKSVYEDQIHAMAKASVNRNAGPLDFSLLTDGLRAEREQGITIDVAYRYFATARRKFIIADTPGHEQYTRNMITGASTAELAIILVDARNGALAQSHRHACIASLMNIPHFLVAVNKMDLVGYDEGVFETIRSEFGEFLERLGARHITFIPISALLGDNVVAAPSERMPWYRGPSLLEHLETVEIEDGTAEAPFRFPVQRVIRPSHDFRGYAGQIASGTIRPGDEVLAIPANRRTRIKRIVTYDGDLAEACAPMSVTLELEDEIDISRGDLIASGAAETAPETSRHFEATLVWMNERPLNLSRRYLLKHGAQLVPAEIRRVVHRVNIESLAGEPAQTLELNQLGVVEIDAVRPLYFDPYRQNRRTGSMVVIDPRNNATVGAVMIGRKIDPPAGGNGGPRQRKMAILNEWHEEAVRVLREAGFEVEVGATWI